MNPSASTRNGWPDSADALPFASFEELVAGSYSPRTDVLFSAWRIPGGGVLSNWVHEFAHLLQFRGTPFGVAWHFLDRVRIVAARELLQILPRPIRTPVSQCYTTKTSDEHSISLEPGSHAAQYLALWKNATTLIDVLMGNHQTDSAESTIQLLESLNPLFGELFGDVDLTPVKCLLTHVETGERGYWLVPGQIAPFSPPRIKRGAIGGLDMVEGHAKIVGILLRMIEVSAPNASPEVKAKHQYDHQRYGLVRNEYAHAISLYASATGFVGQGRCSGLTSTWGADDSYRHLSRASIVMLESLMIPVCRKDKTRPMEWTELHPGWRFFCLLNYVAEHPNPLDVDCPVDFAHSLAEHNGWVSRERSVEFAKTLVRKIPEITDWEASYFDTTLDFNLLFPDGSVALNLRDTPPSVAFLSFLAQYPVLYRSDVMDHIETLGAIHGVMLSDDAIEQTYKNLVRGTWHNILGAFMSRRQTHGIRELVDSLKARFPEESGFIDQLVGELVLIDRKQIC